MYMIGLWVYKALAESTPSFCVLPAEPPLNWKIFEEGAGSGPGFENLPSHGLGMGSLVIA